MGGLTACSWIYLEKLVFSADIYVLGLHSPGAVQGFILFDEYRQ